MDRVIVEIREPGREPRRVSVTATVEVGRECSGILLGDRRVSRRHIALTASLEGLTLTDLGSSNGTTVNGHRVTAPVVVRVGDVIRLGGTEIGVVERTAAPPRPASAPPERLTLLDPTPSPPAAETAAPTVEAPVPPLPAAPPPPAPGVDAAALRAAAGDDGRLTLLVSAAVTDDPALRAAHREIVEYWLPRSAGRAVASVDGALVCGFTTPRHGLLCAVAVERGLATYNRGREGGGLRVRTALHAGDASPGEAALALRIAAEARPGEVLVSAPVREAAGGGDEFRFGEARTLEVAGSGPVAVVALRPR